MHTRLPIWAAWADINALLVSKKLKWFSKPRFSQNGAFFAPRIC